jgi:hypothetical protein
VADHGAERLAAQRRLGEERQLPQAQGPDHHRLADLLERRREPAYAIDLGGFNPGVGQRGEDGLQR